MNPTLTSLGTSDPEVHPLANRTRGSTMPTSVKPQYGGQCWSSSRSRHLVSNRSGTKENNEVDSYCIIMLNTYVQGANTKFLVSLGIQFPGDFLAVWLIGPRISPLFDMERNPWSNAMLRS